MKKVRKAIIPAAGLGTRFLPATKAMPKEMLPIVDKPTIQYIVEEAVESGIEDILIVTGRGKRAIEDHFDNAFELEQALLERKKLELLEEVKRSSRIVDIHYIRQKEPKGLGHAVWCARKFVGHEPFAVLLGDDIIKADTPCLLQMINKFEFIQNSIVAVQPVLEDDVSRYGILDPVEQYGRLYKAKRLIEKPAKEQAPSNLAIMGRYILTPNIFDFLERAETGANGEIQLTDAIQKLAEVEDVYAYQYEGTRYDVGDKLGYILTSIEFALMNKDLRITLLNSLEEMIKRSRISV
ncbi:UTP--glucose-1-phosphate uridylyltransferase GalU [Cohnella terricola]|uniref:UTP--glucose-1-phosphate uridylyltransferase n=1 Tax=Cohnella terricola TaxID=1289167 RepID=A0A559JMM5_9BACL|nr:UTP--glucose-1-phosphate uridylyltransferase GalU [Cohnella terricola]TVY01129.1 UTP--glucose-1-phosphate uridylyltransferase GalU [Cohnella terricola]